MPALFFCDVAVSSNAAVCVFTGAVFTVTVTVKTIGNRGVAVPSEYRATFTTRKAVLLEKCESSVLS